MRTKKGLYSTNIKNYIVKNVENVGKIFGRFFYSLPQKAFLLKTEKPVSNHCQNKTDYYNNLAFLQM